MSLWVGADKTLFLRSKTFCNDRAILDPWSSRDPCFFLHSCMSSMLNCRSCIMLSYPYFGCKYPEFWPEWLLSIFIFFLIIIASMLRGIFVNMWSVFMWSVFLWKTRWFIMFNYFQFIFRIFCCPVRYSARSCVTQFFSIYMSWILLLHSSLQWHAVGVTPKTKSGR